MFRPDPVRLTLHSQAHQITTQRLSQRPSVLMASTSSSFLRMKANGSCRRGLALECRMKDTGTRVRVIPYRRIEDHLQTLMQSASVLSLPGRKFPRSIDAYRTFARIAIAARVRI